MNVAFRVDASLEIGLGHLMRCLALSEELTRKGNVCYFLSKTENDELINEIEKFDVNYHKIKPSATLNDDVETLIKFSNEKDVKWIITDHYGINAEYIQKIKRNNFNVLSIDDTAQIHYYSDIILNQNVGAEKLDFSSEKYSKFLLGTKYVMLRDELLQNYKRKENDKVAKILIMLGGTDPGNATLKVLKMLESLNESVQFLVISGPASPFYDDIKEYSKETDLEITLLKFPKNMMEVYLDMDMAISAGGSTCYELAYFGIPNLIITIADNQLRIARELDKEKVGIYLGKENEVKAEQLKNKVKSLINDDSLRNNMSQKGRQLVDGKGKKRLVETMERYS